jgi:hypothetical protein
MYTVGLRLPLRRNAQAIQCYGQVKLPQMKAGNQKRVWRAIDGIAMAVVAKQPLGRRVEKVFRDGDYQVVSVVRQQVGRGGHTFCKFFDFVWGLESD